MRPTALLAVVGFVSLLAAPSLWGQAQKQQPEGQAAASQNSSLSANQASSQSHNVTGEAKHEQQKQQSQQQARNMSSILLSQPEAQIKTNSSLQPAASRSSLASAASSTKSRQAAASGGPPSPKAHYLSSSQVQPSQFQVVSSYQQQQQPNYEQQFGYPGEQYQAYSTKSQLGGHHSRHAQQQVYGQLAFPAQAEPHFSGSSEQYDSVSRGRLLAGTSASGMSAQASSQHQQQQQQQQQQVLLYQQSGYSYPCRSPLQDISQQQQQQQLLGAPPRYLRLGDGTRLRSQFVFKVLRVDSLTDCELACTRSASLANHSARDACRSFNFRAYFAAENCELSRYEARALRIADAQHFEQNTQFDFYALDPLLASQQQQQQQSNGLVLARAGSPSSTYLDPSMATDCAEVSQTCNQDGMEFSLRTSEPFHGRIYTYGFYDSCYVDGDGSTTNLLRITRSNGFPRCGTQQIGDLMTNIVVVQYSDFVQTTRDKKYNLTCYFSGPGEAVVTSNYFDTKIDERSHPVQIEHLPPQNVITSNVQLRVLYRGQPTNAIAVGDLLTFRLETSANRPSLPLGPSSSAPATTMISTMMSNPGGAKGANSQFANATSSGAKQRASGRSAAASARYSASASTSGAAATHEIFATNVIAKDPFSGRQVLLIDARGCPVDPVNVFPELQRTPDGALESEFYAFKIPDSNLLIFQATVRTCRAPCEPVICSTPSGNQMLLGQQHQLTSPIELSLASQQRQQQYELAGVVMGSAGAVKTGASLVDASQTGAAPSWGRRRRRRSLDKSATASKFDDELGNDDETESLALSAGESVEHVIPARLADRSAAAPDLAQVGHARRGVETFKGPELSEAEEEVKEMFRVYLSRAELRAKNRAAQVAPPTSPASNSISGFGSAEAPLVAQFSTNESSPQTASGTTPLVPHHELLCLSQAGYYVMLFAMISLSLLMLAQLSMAFLATKTQSKFHLSDSISGSMY